MRTFVRRTPVSRAIKMSLRAAVLPRSSFEAGWRRKARSLASDLAAAIKRVTGQEISAAEAISAFARLWVTDAHWEATERLINGGK